LTTAYSILGDEVDYIYVGDASIEFVNTAISFPGKCWVEFSQGTATKELVEYALSQNLKVSAYFGNDMRRNRDLINMGVSRFVVDTFSDIVIPIEN
jgi:hypothetical protein